MLTLFIGLFAGKKLGGIFGLLIGIYLDLLTSKTIGFSGILLGVIGLLGEYFDKSFSKDSKITIILLVIGSTMFYEILTYAISFVRFQIGLEILPFIKILAIELVFNTILIIIIYPLMKRFGYFIEDAFKGKKILTRYF